MHEYISRNLNLFSFFMFFSYKNNYNRNSLLFLIRVFEALVYHLFKSVKVVLRSCFN